ncbi:MAG: aminoglycoside N(3)-acetyltransferase [Elainellaceae cyanobacterium]
MSEAKAVSTSLEPVTQATLVRDLQALGLASGDVVLVHSSLSAMGWVCGGAQTVIQALVETVGAAGTLVMPAQSSDRSDPQLWEQPPVPEAWWDTIRETMPAFDPALTPTRGMGVIAETFRKHPGAVRSRHPTLSFAALGPEAATIIAEQVLEDGVGERSPLGKLYDLEGRVLLLGVGHGNNTTLHLSERRALGAAQVKHETGAPIAVDGVRRWVTFWQPLLDAADFEQVGAAFEQQTFERHGSKRQAAARRGRVGQAEARLLAARSLVDFAVPWFKAHRTDARPPSN